jgi:hypothetical protein
MPAISPYTITLFIVLAVAFVGAIIAFARDRARFHGYQDLSKEVLRLGRVLKGEVFRDGEDVVASGCWNHLPVQVRFSHASNTPGLEIRMGAPAGFILSIMPARSTEGPGRVRVRTPDEAFNTSFVVRSDDPTQAHFLVTDRQVMGYLRSLCHSSETFLLFSHGWMQFGELGEPDQQKARKAFERLENLGRLAQKLSLMPGAEMIKIEPLRRRRAWAVRFALVVGMVASLAGLMMEARPYANARAARTPNVSENVGFVDAKLIGGLANWRLAEADDIDAAALSWARAQHQTATARIEGTFCAGEQSRDVAYLLVGQNKARRVVLLCQGENIYDSRYDYVGVAVRVPKERVPSIQWSVKPPEPPEGDGLLITLAPDNPAAGMVLFFRGRRILSGVPVNYQSIRLE